MSRVPVVLRVVRPRFIAAAATVMAASALVIASPAAAPAAGGQTVAYTLHVPAMALDNLCNGDTVNLSGDLRIRETTTPRSDGGYTVQSTTRGDNLLGQRIAPLPMIGYKGSDDEDSYAYYAPSGANSFLVTHSTTLVPQSNAPKMYLVTVIRETILADGMPAIPTLERTYLTCKPPQHKAERDDD